ncbi:hypothetical protein [Pseudomonas sp. UBA1879]|uniref:hypothetical protein n=1 Tax=Pseudomonas sp. UBA1879 TaxID=1947305 RepID=UPI0025DE8557|nr:hypothetical protein [Pseudomonas sp. UBA1879]
MTVQWKLVPTVAHRQMQDAGAEAARKYMEETGSNSEYVIYNAMVAAAPEPPSEFVREVHTDGLRACPCCGCRAKLTEWQRGFIVECLGCSLTSLCYVSISEALEAWNQRTLETLSTQIQHLLDDDLLPALIDDSGMKIVGDNIYNEWDMAQQWNGAIEACAQRFDRLQSERDSLRASLDLIGAGLIVSNGSQNTDAIRMEIHALQERDLDQLGLLIESKEMLVKMASTALYRGDGSLSDDLKGLAQRIHDVAIAPITEGKSARAVERGDDLDDALRELASSACQEALSFGVNEDVFLRLARSVRQRVSAKRDAGQ